jgi:hypothetical protein
MILEKKFLRPKLGTFLKYLTLLIISFWTFATLLYIFTSPNPFDLKLPSWWTLFILLPIGVAIGLTFGTREFQLVITDTNDLEKAKEWTLEFLSKNRLSIKDKNQNETTLESTKSYNRLFNNWFGTELISVRQIDNKLIVGGPYRLVDRLADSVDSKLRFGKSLE